MVTRQGPGNAVWHFMIVCRGRLAWLVTADRMMHPAAAGTPWPARPAPRQGMAGHQVPWRHANRADALPHRPQVAPGMSPARLRQADRALVGISGTSVGDAVHESSR